MTPIFPRSDMRQAGLDPRRNQSPVVPTSDGRTDRDGSVVIFPRVLQDWQAMPKYAPCEICKTTWTSEKICTECRNDLSGYSAREADERVAPAKQVGLRAVEADALLDSEGANPSTPTNVP